MRIAALVCGLALLISPLRADTIYVSTYPGEFFGTYNTLTNSFTPLGHPDLLYGLGFAGGTLYAIDASGRPSLYTVNTSNGALTDVGPLDNPGGPGDFASTPGGGLYFVDSSDLLYTVSAATGLATAVGPLGLSVGTGNLAFGPDGNFYIASGFDLYNINTATGAGTLVGNFGGGVSFTALVSADGLFYGFDGSSMYNINLTTGAATFVQTLPAGVGQFEAATPLEAPSPEPGSLLLCLTGAAVFLRKLGRKSHSEAHIARPWPAAVQ
jgi:hypothetical protein